MKATKYIKLMKIYRSNAAACLAHAFFVSQVATGPVHNPKYVACSVNHSVVRLVVVTVGVVYSLTHGEVFLMYLMVNPSLWVEVAEEMLMYLWTGGSHI